MFRELQADEIETRLQNFFAHGCILILYKDARCDMNVLDETVGPQNWQRRHYDCKGNLFCSVGIRIPQDTGEWIWKDDAGAESRTEKQKGEASDSFKRACTNWGIGRELYTSPFIWIPANNQQGQPNYKTKEKEGKLAIDDYFTVTHIGYTDSRISSLAIENKGHCPVFIFGDVPVSGQRVGDSEKPKDKGGDLNQQSKLPICPVCNKLVKKGTRKDRSIMTPDEVLAELGMCGACYKEKADDGK